MNSVYSERRKIINSDVNSKFYPMTSNSSSDVLTVLAARSPNPQPRVPRGGRAVVLYDNNLLGEIIKFLPETGCLNFLLACKAVYSCYTKYMKKKIVSDYKHYCATERQVQWCTSLPRSPITLTSYKKILLGSIVSADLFWFKVAFVERYGEVNHHHSELKLIFSQDRDLFLCTAARYGRLDMLQHFKEIEIWLNPPPECVLRAAARGGQNHIVQFLLSLTPPSRVTGNVLYEAAKHGHLSTLKLLKGYDPTCEWLCSTTLVVAEEGHFNVLKWMASLTTPPLPPWRSDMVCKLIKHADNNFILHWLIRQPFIVIDKSAARNAIVGNNLKGLQMLREGPRPCPLTNPRLADDAIEVESVEILQYLKEQGYFDSFDLQHRRFCNNAARKIRGSIELLQWLRSQDPPAPWFAGTMAIAAEVGNIPALAWAREQTPPCPWGPQVCSRAIEHGHLDTLKWLRSRDPPCHWNQDCVEKAASRGDLAILEYLRVESDPKCPWHPYSIAIATLQSCNIAVIEWLLRPDILSSPMLLIRATDDFLQSRRPYTMSSYDNSISFRREYHKLIKFLHEHDLLLPPFNDNNFVSWFTGPAPTIGGGNIRVTSWVRDNLPHLYESFMVINAMTNFW